jgi:hypothetical protein
MAASTAYNVPSRDSSLIPNSNSNSTSLSDQLSEHLAGLESSVIELGHELLRLWVCVRAWTALLKKASDFRLFELYE